MVIPVARPRFMPRWLSHSTTGSIAIDKQPREQQQEEGSCPSRGRPTSPTESRTTATTTMTMMRLALPGVMAIHRASSPKGTPGCGVAPVPLVGGMARVVHVVVGAHAVSLRPPFRRAGDLPRGRDVPHAPARSPDEWRTWRLICWKPPVPAGSPAYRETHDAAGRTHSLPRRVQVVSTLAAEIPRTPRADRFAHQGWSHLRPPTAPNSRDVITMSEDAKAARQALQESMDLRDQGHTED